MEAYWYENSACYMQAENCQLASNGWFTEPPMHVEAPVPQLTPYISPQFWPSSYGEEVMYDQYHGADQCLSGGTLQEGWFPECQYMWVPFEQVPQTQQYPMPEYEYYSQEIPSEESSFLEEQEAAQLQHLQPQFEMINEHVHFDNQGEVVWADSETYLPYMPCHLQSNLHAPSCGPQFQDPQCQYFQALPDHGGFDNQTTFDCEAAFQQTAFEEQVPIQSYHILQQQNKLAYDPSYQSQGESPEVECVPYVGSVPISNPTEGSIQQPYSLNYVQPGQYSQPQQQHILYYIAPGPVYQPEMIAERYDTLNYDSKTDQYDHHYSGVCYFPQYVAIEQQQKVLSNHVISAPDVQEGGCQMTKMDAFIPCETQQVCQTVSYPHCYTEEERLQGYVLSDSITSYECQMQSVSPQPHEAEHQRHFVPQEAAYKHLDLNLYCKADIPNQQSFRDSECSTSEKKLEEKDEALVLSNKCSSVPVTQETVSYELPWCDTRQVTKEETKFIKENPDLIHSKQEENLLDPIPSFPGNEENQTVDETMDVSDGDTCKRTINYTNISHEMQKDIDTKNFTDFFGDQKQYCHLQETCELLLYVHNGHLCINGKKIVENFSKEDKADENCSQLTDKKGFKQGKQVLTVTEMERKSEEENIKEAETYEEVQNCKEAKSMDLLGDQEQYCHQQETCEKFLYVHNGHLYINGEKIIQNFTKEDKTDTHYAQLADEKSSKQFLSVTETERVAEKENVKKDKTHDDVQSYKEKKNTDLLVDQEQYYHQQETCEQFLYVHNGHLYIDGKKVVQNFANEDKADKNCSQLSDEKDFKHEKQLTTVTEIERKSEEKNFMKDEIHDEVQRYKESNIMDLLSGQEQYCHQQETCEQLLYVHNGHLYINGEKVVENFTKEDEIDKCCSQLLDEKRFKSEDQFITVTEIERITEERKAKIDEMQDEVERYKETRSMDLLGGQEQYCHQQETSEQLLYVHNGHLYSNGENIIQNFTKEDNADEKSSQLTDNKRFKHEKELTTVTQIESKTEEKTGNLAESQEEVQSWKEANSMDLLGDQEQHCYQQETRQQFLYVHNGHLYINGKNIVENFTKEDSTDKNHSQLTNEKCVEHGKQVKTVEEIERITEGKTVKTVALQEEAQSCKEPKRTVLQDKNPDLSSQNKEEAALFLYIQDGHLYINGDKIAPDFIKENKSCGSIRASLQKNEQAIENQTNEDDEPDAEMNASGISYYKGEKQVNHIPMVYNSMQRKAKRKFNNKMLAAISKRKPWIKSLKTLLNIKNVIF